MDNVIGVLDAIVQAYIDILVVTAALVVTVLWMTFCINVLLELFKGPPRQIHSGAAPPPSCISQAYRDELVRNLRVWNVSSQAIDEAIRAQILTGDLDHDVTLLIRRQR